MTKPNQPESNKGHSVQEVASRLGVSSHSLYKWVKAVRPEKNEERADELLEAKKQILNYEPSSVGSKKSETS